MKSPLVSVVIPVYNRGARLQPTVQSVLEQTLSSAEIEIIIVDDGSTDDTVAFLHKTYGDEPRVKIVTQPNGGVARARNRGLEEARGEFIAYLDHDDFWLPHKIEQQLALSKASPISVWCIVVGLMSMRTACRGHRAPDHAT
jgi:glycosyltransferase involved in cell wall biosynthesis